MDVERGAGGERMARELMCTRKRGVEAMQEANRHAEDIRDCLKRMVDLKEAEVVASKRARKIEALEKQLLLGMGNPKTLRDKLETELEAQWGS